MPDHLTAEGETGWGSALSRQIGRTIDHWREVRGMSRTELAAACTRAGLPTKRPALAVLLEGRRQTVTVQELVAFATVLEVSVAELMVPLHAGTEAVVGPVDLVQPFDAAVRLFGLDREGDLTRSGPYRLYARYLRAAARFEGANTRLIEMSHRIATGEAQPEEVNGRPHPASELLAAEAALSRLLDARDRLLESGLIPPRLDPERDLPRDSIAPRELPLLDHLPDGAGQFPLYVYELELSDLPAPRRVERPPARSAGRDQ